MDFISVFQHSQLIADLWWLHCSMLIDLGNLLYSSFEHFLHPQRAIIGNSRAYYLWNVVCKLSQKHRPTCWVWLLRIQSIHTVDPLHPRLWGESSTCYGVNLLWRPINVISLQSVEVFFIQNSSDILCEIGNWG